MENNKKSLGYIVGQICGVVLIGCVTSIVVISTIKLLTWLLAL